MITRIVKLKFDAQYISDFKYFAKEIEAAIKKQDGCLHLDIYQDIKDESIFFTYSKWENEDALNNYRKSDFFRNIWPKTKKWFAAKPEAWSVIPIVEQNAR